MRLSLNSWTAANRYFLPETDKYWQHGETIGLDLEVGYWSPSDADADVNLARVLQLYKAGKSTLGFMPDSAFADRGPRQGLVLGRVDGQIAGYVLFDRPRSIVKLIHVCVDLRCRGVALAKRMIDFIAAENQSRSMLLAACREDYDLESFWRSVGMRPLSEKPGRALGGSVLVNWVRALGGPDLLEEAELFSGRPRVVLDTNVISDLYSTPQSHRPDREESRALSADWVQNAVSFVISGEVDFELRRMRDRTERQHQQREIQHLTRLGSRRPDDNSLDLELLDQINPVLRESDESLPDDVKHLADAVHGQVDFAVSNDEGLIAAVMPWLATKYGLELVRPHRLIQRLRETPEGVFESRLIDAVDLIWEPVGARVDEVGLAFQNYEANERGADLKRRIRGNIANNYDACKVLIDSGGKFWAMSAMSEESGALDVSLLRAGRGHISGTVSFQLARYIRKQALIRGLSKVRVTDPGLTDDMRLALEADGFDVKNAPEAHLDDRCVPLAKLAEVASTAEGRARDVATLERSAWPLVVTHADIPTYVIPIHPRYAELLFGYGEQLVPWNRKRGLGLSREQVYFFGAATKLPPGPVRLLWYATADKDSSGKVVHIVRRLVARSRLVESSVLPAAEAHERFGHVGVLSKKQILGAADKKGRVHVVRFEDTELLDRSLSQAEYNGILKNRGVGTFLMTMRSVPSAVFDDVMNTQPGRLP